MLQALAIGVGVALCLEGLAYAVAPGLMKRLMARVLSTPEQGLRVAGVSTLAIGVILVAVLR